VLFHVVESTYDRCKAVQQAALQTDRVIEVVCFKNSCAADAAFLGCADKGLTCPGRLTYLAVQLQTIK
jgi:hypothetical protein